MLTHLWGSSWQLGQFQFTPCAFQVWALAYFCLPRLRNEGKVLTNGGLRVGRSY